MAVKTPTQGWVVLPSLSQPVQALSTDMSAAAVQARRIKGQPFWEWNGPAGTTNKPISWALAGTLPDWQGSPLAAVVVLENADQASAAVIAQELLASAIQP